MLDYLAEVTMSILQKQKERDPNIRARLHRRDGTVMTAVVDRGVRVIANAGGVNRSPARARCSTPPSRARGELRVGVPRRLLPHLDALIDAGIRSPTWRRASH